MPQTSQDYYIEATYEDGFVYRGDRKDTSLFVEGKNQFYDVVEGLLEEEHGKLVKWAVVGTAGNCYTIDFATDLPSYATNIRPILYREMERDYMVDQDGTVISEGTLRTMKTVFGAQWNDTEGRNQQITEELE